MRKNKLVYVLGFAPLLLGADPNIEQNESALAVTTALPKCGPNEYLSYQANGLVCRSFETGSVKVPDCSSAGQLLTYKSGGEFADFACVDKGSLSLSMGDITTINNLTQLSVQINNNITNIQANPPAAAAVFVGTTTAATTGRMSSGGQVGIAAGAALCDAQYKGARMCSVYDMFRSAATGVITQATTLPATGAWVYMEAWQIRPGFTNVAPQEPTAGLWENCAGYIYGTGDRGWTGTLVRFETTTLNTTDKVLKFFSGSADAACSLNRPIACCK
jgi:hypothetical protein